MLRYVGSHSTLELLLRCQDIQCLNTEKPSNALVGKLYAMCSRQEILQKINVNTANDLERSKDKQVNKHLALKSFQRSDASRTFSPEEIRPLIWCRRTIYNILCHFIDADITQKPYLMRKDYSYIDVYNFLRDRLRSIWQDLTVQHCTKHRSYIECFEISIRFLLYSHYQLLDHPEYDSVQNLGLINTCLVKLMNGYSDVKNYRNKFPGKPVDQISEILVYSSPHQDEFWSYRLLLAIRNIQNNGGGTIFADICKRIPHDIFKSPLVQFAAKTYIAAYDNNICKYFKLIQSASPLQAVLMNRFDGIIRIRWLYYLTKDKILRSPMAYDTFIKHFGYLSGDNNQIDSDRLTDVIKSFIERYGIEVTIDESNSKHVNLSDVKMDAIEQDIHALAKVCNKIEVRSQTVDLKFQIFLSRQKILDPDFESLPPIPFDTKLNTDDQINKVAVSQLKPPQSVQPTVFSTHTTTTDNNSSPFSIQRNTNTGSSPFEFGNGTNGPSFFVKPENALPFPPKSENSTPFVGIRNETQPLFVPLKDNSSHFCSKPENQSSSTSAISGALGNDTSTPFMDIKSETFQTNPSEPSFFSPTNTIINAANNENAPKSEVNSSQFIPIEPDSSVNTNPIMQIKLETADKFLVIKEENSKSAQSDVVIEAPTPLFQSLQSVTTPFSLIPSQTKADNDEMSDKNRPPFPNLNLENMPQLSTNCDSYPLKPLKPDLSSSVKTASPFQPLEVTSETSHSIGCEIPPLNLQNSLKYSPSILCSTPISSPSSALSTVISNISTHDKFDTLEFTSSITDKVASTRIKAKHILTEKKIQLPSLSVQAVAEIRNLQNLLKKRERPDFTVPMVENEEVVKKAKLTKKSQKRNFHYTRITSLLDPRRILRLWVDDVLNTYYYYKRLGLNAYYALKDFKRTVSNFFSWKDNEIDPMLENLVLNVANMNTAITTNKIFGIKNVTFRIHFICNIKLSNESFWSTKNNISNTPTECCIDLASLFLTEMGFSNSHIFLNNEISISKYGYYKTKAKATATYSSKKKFTAIYSLSRSPVIVNTNIPANGFVLFLDKPVDVVIRDGDVTHHKKHLNEWLRNLHVLTIEPILENIKNSNGRHAMVVFYILGLHCDKSSNLDAMYEKIDAFSKHVNNIIFKHLSSLGSVYLSDRINSGRMRGKKSKYSPFIVGNLGYARIEDGGHIDSVLNCENVNYCISTLIRHCFDKCGINLTLNQPNYESIKNFAVELLMDQLTNKVHMDMSKTPVVYNLRREIVSGLSEAIHEEIYNCYVNYPLQTRKSIFQCVKNMLSKSHKSKDNHHTHFLLDRIIKLLIGEENATKCTSLRNDLELCVESASADFHLGPENFQMIPRNKGLMSMQHISSSMKLVTKVLDHLQIDDLR